MGPHRDDAEPFRGAPVISVSLGCSCVFLVGGRTEKEGALAVFLRSGDVVLMGGEERLALHGVGAVFPGAGDEALMRVLAAASDTSDALNVDVDVEAVGGGDEDEDKDEDEDEAQGGRDGDRCCDMKGVPVDGSGSEAMTGCRHLSSTCSVQCSPAKYKVRLVNDDGLKSTDHDSDSDPDPARTTVSSQTRCREEQRQGRLDRIDSTPTCMGLEAEALSRLLGCRRLNVNLRQVFE